MSFFIKASQISSDERMPSLAKSFSSCCWSFFKQKTAYDITRWLEFRRVLFRSVVSQLIQVAGTHVASHRRGPAGKHEHDVFAHRVQFFPVPGAESLAQPDQQEQRSHPPGDPEHGQERADLMRPQGA